MFAGFAYGQGYYAGIQIGRSPHALLVEIATVLSLNPSRLVVGAVDYRVGSRSHGRTVQSLDDQRVRSSSPVRTVEGIP